MVSRQPQPQPKPKPKPKPHLFVLIEPLGREGNVPTGPAVGLYIYGIIHGVMCLMRRRCMYAVRDGYSGFNEKNSPLAFAVGVHGAWPLAEPLSFVLRASHDTGHKAHAKNRVFFLPFLNNQPSTVIVCDCSSQSFLISPVKPACNSPRSSAPLYSYY